MVENMHLHWKHRELVKVICKEKEAAKVDQAARMLAYESGGILVCVEKNSKGLWLMVYYRGKNYERPTQLRPKGLLTKRQALKRAVEEQRREVRTWQHGGGRVDGDLTAVLRAVWVPQSLYGHMKVMDDRIQQLRRGLVGGWGAGGMWDVPFLHLAAQSCVGGRA